MRHPMAATKIAWAAVAAMLLFIAMLVLASPGASAAVAGEIASPATSSTPMPTSSPSPSTTPNETESDEDRHQQQNGEQPVERDDLGFLGIFFVVGIGFILVAGAVGVAFAGRNRRRHDRAAAEADGGA